MNKIENDNKDTKQEASSLPNKNQQQQPESVSNSKPAINHRKAGTKGEVGFYFLCNFSALWPFVAVENLDQKMAFLPHIITCTTNLIDFKDKILSQIKKPLFISSMVLIYDSNFPFWDIINMPYVTVVNKFYFNHRSC